MMQPTESPSDEKYQPGSLPEVFQLIETLEKKLKRMQEQTLRVDHLTPPQYVILTRLSEQDGRPFKELAELLFCTRASVTGIVDTMEKKGLVRRAPNPEDRRSVLVQLSAKGRELIQNTPGMRKAFGSCCDVLEGQETSDLARLLKKLNDGLFF